MQVPMEFLVVIFAALLGQIGAIIGFIWKYNQSYVKDKELAIKSMNEIKDSITSEVRSMIQDIHLLEDKQSRCRLERSRETDLKFQQIDNDNKRERDMSKRDISELAAKIDGINKKVDQTQESISEIHRRIDELFKMIKAKAPLKSTPVVKKTTTSKQS